MSNLWGVLQNTEIEGLLFFPETETEYTQSTILRDDKIDVFITNLLLTDNWHDVEKEDLYFVFEFKRLLNTKKNLNYLSDTQKFVERKYSQFRFPFNGMIGLVEKSSVSISKIIEDIEKKLKQHQIIKSIDKDGEFLTNYSIENFKYCKISRHNHNSQKGTIEVFHLFFDYSEIITN